MDDPSSLLPPPPPSYLPLLPAQNRWTPKHPGPHRTAHDKNCRTPRIPGRSQTTTRSAGTLALLAQGHLPARAYFQRVRRLGQDQVRRPDEPGYPPE